jgi:hypothetical protein
MIRLRHLLPSGRVIDVALVTVVLAGVGLSYAGIFAAVRQVAAMEGTNASFSDVYAAGRNPWAHASIAQTFKDYTAGSRHAALPQGR